MAYFINPVNADWSAKAFLDQIVLRIQERQTVVGLTLRANVTIGDDVQARSFIVGLQADIESLLDDFVDHTQGSGNFSGSSIVPMWSSVSFFLALNGGTSWRRKVDYDDDFSYGQIASGDIIGYWIFEDLQNALKLLKWVVRVGKWEETGGLETGSTYIGQSTYSIGTEEDITTAKSNAEADWHIDWSRDAPIVYGVLNEASGFPADAIIFRCYGVIINNEELPLFSGPTAKIDIYYPVIKPAVTNGIFNANGDGVTESTFTTFARQRNDEDYDGSGDFSLQIGKTNVFPIWPARIAGERAEKGYYTANDISLTRFVIKMETVFEDIWTA